jgi:Ca-activated chloride channel family protein
MKISILLIFMLGLTFCASAQKERKYIREGNDYYKEGLKDTAKLDTVSFGKAEVAYRRALEIKPNDFQWQFNLADAIYKQKKSEEASTEFEKLADQTVKPIEKASVYHNLGNSFLTQKKFDPSIEAYKKALRINPNDPETKYNLAYAMKMKKEEEKKKQQNQNKQDKDNKKNQDKNKQDNNKNQDQNKDQNQNNQNQDQKQQNQQNKPQQNKITRQNAEQMLQALENDEKQTQEKVKKAQALKAQRSKVEKNW